MSEVSFAAAYRCWDCGRTVNCTQGRRRFHWCRLRFLSRARWTGHLEGWHEGYRFAVENPADPMVAADGVDYGTGWAGVMRTGGFQISGDAL